MCRPVSSLPPGEQRACVPTLCPLPKLKGSVDRASGSSQGRPSGGLSAGLWGRTLGSERRVGGLLYTLWILMLSDKQGKQNAEENATEERETCNFCPCC